MFLRTLTAISIFSLVHAVSAQPGSSCDSAVVVVPGTHVAPADNYWYRFTPATTGVYRATTCGLSSCDTKLWAYDECQGLV